MKAEEERQRQKDADDTFRQEADRQAAVIQSIPFKVGDKVLLNLKDYQTMERAL